MSPASKSPLFSPTLQGYTREAALNRKKPLASSLRWRVAVIGGILPTLVFGCINGKRLNTSRNKQSLILAIGLLGLFAVIVLAVGSSTAQNSPGDNYMSILFTHRLIAVIVYYFIYRLQLSDFRVYCVRFRDDKDILEKTNSATGMVIGLTLLQELALYSMMAVLTRVR